VFGHLPDEIGGAKVALACALIDVVGLGFMGLASLVILAATGAALPGLGYARAFPAPGAVASLVAGQAGFSNMFRVSALCVLCVVPIALRLK